MHGHDRGGNEADHMFGQRPHHLLTPLAANQIGFACLFTHGESLRQSLDQIKKGVKARPGSMQVE
jgi:hypothetical protein